jgi:hypothetical protein
MNVRKNMVLVVGGAICVALICAAGFMLFRYWSAYVDVRSKAQAAEMRLQQLNDRGPFPSADNVEVVKANQSAIQKFAVAILGSLSEGQDPIPAVEAAEFAPMLEKAKQRLLSHAAGAGVKIPDRFGLGFDRYTKGELPSEAAIPRLVTQLRAAETVLGLLFDARMAEISDMQREPFEGEPAAATSSGDRRGGGAGASGGASKWSAVPLAESNELYRAERIYVSCSGRESAVWSLLNAIASHRPLVVLADVKMTNPLGYDAKRGAAPAAGRPGAASPARAAAPARGAAPVATAAPAKIPDREERVVAGRELIKVELLLDVYRFQDEAGKKEGTP